MKHPTYTGIFWVGEVFGARFAQNKIKGVSMLWGRNLVIITPEFPRWRAHSEKRITHPWVGQAEHLACRKRQPGAFAGVAHTHFVP